MRRRNIHESFVTNNDKGTNYVLNEASKERPDSKIKQDYHQIFKANIEGDGNQNAGSKKETTNWNDCANQCAQNNNCALFSATKDSKDKITCNFFNKDFDKSKIKYANNNLSNSNHVWIKTPNEELKKAIWVNPMQLKPASCPSGTTDNGNQQCISNPTCLPGYQISGIDNTKCVSINTTEPTLTPTCPSGYLLGAANKCRQIQSPDPMPKNCANGSYDPSGKCLVSKCPQGTTYFAPANQCA